MTHPPIGIDAWTETGPMDVVAAAAGPSKLVGHGVAGR